MDKAVVLIVEDQALIRMHARLVVEDAGFAVVEACDADEALKILQGRSDVRAVFTDTNMSGSMDGWKLAHAVRGGWPPIHLLVTSGANAPNEGQLPAKSRFIAKPYSPEHLIAVLRELFGKDPVPNPLISADGTKVA